jgi:hypothetical protein
VTASGNHAEQRHGLYRLKVKTSDTPVVITDMEPDFLQLDAFTLGEVRIEGHTLEVNVFFEGEPGWKRGVRHVP